MAAIVVAGTVGDHILKCLADIDIDEVVIATKHCRAGRGVGASGDGEIDAVTLVIRSRPSASDK